MTFKIPDITWAVGHSFNLYVGLQGPGWPYVLGMPPRGDLRLWTPRARAADVGQGPHLRPGVPAGSLRATEPRAREKARGRKRKKCRWAKKTHLYIVISVIQRVQVYISNGKYTWYFTYQVLVYTYTRIPGILLLNITTYFQHISSPL